LIYWNKGICLVQRMVHLYFSFQCFAGIRASAWCSPNPVVPLDQGLYNVYSEKNPRWTFMVFVKPMESVVGLCENRKAHAGMGRIFPLWNEASECTEKI
jgi:hypothetical protein